MSKGVKKSVALGSTSGFGLGLVILLLHWINNRLGDAEILQNIINFFAAVPTFMFARLDKLNPLVMDISFFIYWVLIGGLFGFLLGKKKWFFNATVVILLVGLVVFQRKVQLKMERELSAALRALFEALIGGNVR